MARLPIPGADDGNWGTVLNDYLSQAHNADGTLKLDVKTIAELKNIDVTTLTDKQQALVAGYSAPGDGGGGQFYYDAGASDADNGGTVIAPTAGSGRWKRVYSGAVNVRWFGAKGDGTTDNSGALLATISFLRESGGGTFFIPSGEYAYSDGLLIPRSPVINLVGEGMKESVLKYTGSGKAISFDISVVSVGERFHWRDFMLDCKSSTATHGIEFTSAAGNNGFRWCQFESIFVWGSNQIGSVGITIDGMVVASFDTIFSRNWKVGYLTKESNIRVSQLTFTNCTAQECDTYGWQIDNEARACRLITCRVEGRGSTPVQTGFYVDGSGLTNVAANHLFLGCETEDEYTDADFRFENAQAITMINGGPGTNATGDGIVMSGCSQCHLQNLSIAPHEASGKKAVILTGNSVANYISGKYESISDSTDLDRWDRFQVDSGSERNTMQLTFDGGATTPLRFGGSVPANRQKAVSSSGTIDFREAGTYLVDASAGPVTLTLGSIAARPYMPGARFTFKKIDSTANAVTIDGAGSETIDSALTKQLTSQWQALTIEAGSGGVWYTV